MAFKVIISARAIRDLEGIVRYIATDNPKMAETFGLELIAAAEAIAFQPFAGRIVPEIRDPMIREKIFRSYRIVYRAEEEHRRVIISRFWHSARGSPNLSEATE